MCLTHYDDIQIIEYTVFKVEKCNKCEYNTCQTVIYTKQEGANLPVEFSKHHLFVGQTK